MNKNGQMIMIQLLFLVMTIMVLIALIGPMRSMLDIAQQSDNLNCKGYTDVNDASLSYNVSLNNTNTLACMTIDLYLPYILLTVLIGGVAQLLVRRPEEPQYY